VKKLIFLIIVILAGIGIVYKLDIKPPVRDVVKQVNLDNNETKPGETVKTPPVQNVSQ
jgi:hypothetical protein